ncbi:alpha/beta fold hydrolase [Roseofilum casamattae]|uniref:Alpha/beta hydrolase n=1 Tax=Roseofilum casamattae BLCC-M143 TaxID=3022442 RepID=A0ABT7BWQ9_9CYAN|nr:alpha/beta hydrolase [Roseofilum casamattae]MDJ1183601.1 alpha/beta hydrolase [Roseofilum casamattae BLCC-M143]
MIIPPGFEQHSVVTSLGRMVYYQPSESFWGSQVAAQPKLVFLHGFGGGSSAYEWSQVYPAFAADCFPIAPDLMGWGRSDHLERNYTIDDYLTTIREFLEQTCEEPAMVVASSLTAALTIRVAIANPQLFQCLVLTTPAGLSDFGDDYGRSLFAQVVRVPLLDRALYTSAIATEAGISSFLQGRQFAKSDRIYPEIVQAYLQSALQPKAEYAALSFVRGDLCFDLANYMPQLTIPTAILWGKKSEFTGPEIGERLAALNPASVKRFMALENVGLTPQLEVPGLTIGLIRQLLKQLQSSP